MGPAREKYGWSSEPVSPWRKASYLGAVALIFFALNGPLHTLSDDYLFSAHMVQHMLLMLVMPPFLIMGIPPWLIRKAMERPGVARTARILTNPVVAFLAYNVTFIGWHIPQMYNWALMSHDLHIVQHLMFMAVAVMMWWPVVNPVPELERIPTGPLLMMYVFAFGIPSTVVSAFITLSDSVFYPWYAAGSQSYIPIAPGGPASRGADHVDTGNAHLLGGDKRRVLPMDERRVQLVGKGGNRAASGRSCAWSGRRPVAAQGDPAQMSPAHLRRLDDRVGGGRQPVLRSHRPDHRGH